jgi:hypothetical protein
MSTLNAHRPQHGWILVDQLPERTYEFVFLLEMYVSSMKVVIFVLV